jgi:hypothetical protein
VPRARPFFARRWRHGPRHGQTHIADCRERRCDQRAHVANYRRTEQSLALECKRAIVASKRVNSNVCPHCQKEIPSTFNGRYCPHCGVARPETIAPKASTSTTPVVEQALKPFKINWWIFFAVLLAPPLLTLLAAFSTNEHAGADAPPFVAMVGGISSGIVCGIMLALRLGKTTDTRVLLGILFCVILAVVCVTLSCFGCLAGGYKLYFH